MKTVTIELPDKLADAFQGATPEFLARILMSGLQARQNVGAGATHPYIITDPGKRGGRPIIRGTGVTVSLIAGLYKAGDTVDESIQSHPHLHPSWVYDAISYYLDHLEEIEREIRENRMERLAERHQLTIDDRGFVHFPEQGASNGQ